MIVKICGFFLPLCSFSRVWEQNKLLGKVIACVFSFYKSLARESISISVGSLVGLCQWDGSCIVSKVLSAYDTGDRSMRS